MTTRDEQLQKLFLQSAIAARDAARAERDALRAALQSLIDGRDEYEIEYFTGMDTAEARKIINLAYNRK